MFVDKTEYGLLMSLFVFGHNFGQNVECVFTHHRAVGNHLIDCLYFVELVVAEQGTARAYFLQVVDAHNIQGLIMEKAPILLLLPLCGIDGCSQ